MKSESNNLKTLYEYQTCTDTALLSDIKDLAFHEPDLLKYIEITRTGFKFKHYTGFIPTKNYRIQVLPKIMNSGDTEESRQNLIRILLYVFSPAGLSIPKVEIEDNVKLDILDLIIRMYAITLEEQILQGAYRRYIRFSEESKFMRGKLNVVRQINRIDQSKFSVIDFRFSMDNDLNRFFAHATRYFMKVTKNRINADRLSWIDSMFHDEDISPWHHCKINFNRLNERFRVPYIYASMILDNLVIMSGGSRNDMAMIFDMNLIFERFFAQFINKNKEAIFGDFKSEIQIQHKNNNFVYDDNIDNNENGLRSTKPDVKVFLDNNIYIFDTKYKNLNDPQIDRMKVRIDEANSIAPSDLYQMYTYSQVYNAKHTVLVFPGCDCKLSGPYIFTLKDKEKKLWIYMLKLDLHCDNWEGDLVDNFKTHFTEIIKVDHQNNCTFL